MTTTPTRPTRLSITLRLAGTRRWYSHMDWDNGNVVLTRNRDLARSFESRRQAEDAVRRVGSRIDDWDVFVERL